MGLWQNPAVFPPSPLESVWALEAWCLAQSVSWTGLASKPQRPLCSEGPAVLLFSVLFSPRLSPGAWHKLMPTQASEGSSPAVAASPALRRPCWCSLWGGAVPCSAAVGLWDGDLLPRLPCAAREGSASFCVFLLNGEGLCIRVLCSRAGCWAGGPTPWVLGLPSAGFCAYISV